MTSFTASSLNSRVYFFLVPLLIGHLPNDYKSTLKKVSTNTLPPQLAYKEAKNSFTIPGIGKLVLVSRKARVGRNPQTGAAIKIPAKKVVKFGVAKACKDAVLG